MLFVILFSSLTHAQEKEDSLISRLEKTNGKDKIGLLNDLAGYYSLHGNNGNAYKYAKQSLSEIEKYGKKEDIAVPLNILSKYYLGQSNFDSALYYALQARKSAHEYGNQGEEADALGFLGNAYYFKGEYQNANKNWENSLEIKKSLGLENEVATLYLNLGVLRRGWGEYGEAIDYYQEALRAFEKTRDTLNIAMTLGNIGNIYFYFGIDLDKALEYYNQGLEMFGVLNDSLQIAVIKNNIGNIYLNTKKTDEASEYFYESLGIFIRQENKPGIAQTYIYMGQTALDRKNYQQALNYYNKAANLFKELGDRKSYAISYAGIANVYKDMRDYNNAIACYNVFFRIAGELELRKEIMDKYKEVSELYEEEGRYNKALEYYKNYTLLKDSLINEENVRQISEMEAKYDSEKKSREILLQKATIEKKELENKRQRMVIFLAVLAIVSILVVSLLIYRQFRLKKKANILLQQQHDEIKAQRDKIAQQNKEITDSITYASIIQSAILTPHSLFEKLFPEHFIYYRPKQLVSGDFYWLNQKAGKTIVVVADCTGHGVPGAFMSMLGMAYLNEIINKSDIEFTDEILNELRSRMIESLHQTDENTQAKDGMDIAICIIDPEKMEMQFSGAFNPVYIISNNNLEVVRGDRIPIGFSLRTDAYFTRHSITLHKDDIVYLFSDGYCDQFGGENRKKFMSKRFAHLLLDIYHYPMDKQREWLDRTLTEWMGNNDQVDDITVVGIRI